MSTAAPLSLEPISTHNAPLPTFEQLPNDLDALKHLVVELVATLHQERHRSEQLEQRLHLLVQRLFGPRSERFNPHQLLLFAEGLQGEESPTRPSPDATRSPEAGQDAPKRRCRPHGRRRLPEDLPRQEVHHQLSEAERLCLCGQMRIDIGTHSSEQLDWRPASYFVWQHLVHKYLCPHCAGAAAKRKGVAASAPAAVPEAAMQVPAPTDPQPTAIGPAIISAIKPTSPIAKGLPGPGLLAHIIVSKYFDHLPLYRQERIFERQGVVLNRSTTCDWMAACAELLRPLYQLMIREVLQSRWLHTDDTPVKNLGHEPGTTDKARFWIYYGDRSHPYNVFDFTVNHKRDGPQAFLADFAGYLHADAFSGYDALYLPDPRPGKAPIIEVACNAHARRKFFEAKGSDDLRAHQALGYYRALYALERSAVVNNFNDEQTLQVRQEFSVPLLGQFKAWLDKERDQVLPKSPMAEAIGYALHNWTALVRYTEAGFLSIDNNVAEREMKRIAIGRKNWLFVGSDQGGRTAAVLFSFTSTCHRLGIEPWAYLQDVLTRLPSLPAERRAELLPDRWQAARPKAAPTARNEATDSQP
jgi:transposase